MNLILATRLLGGLLGCFSIFKGFTLGASFVTSEKINKEKFLQYFSFKKLIHIINGIFMILLSVKYPNLGGVQILMVIVWCIFILIEQCYFYKNDN